MGAGWAVSTALSALIASTVSGLSARNAFEVGDVSRSHPGIDIYVTGSPSGVVSVIARWLGVSLCNAVVLVKAASRVVVSGVAPASPLTPYCAGEDSMRSHCGGPSAALVVLVVTAVSVRYLVTLPGWSSVI